MTITQLNGGKDVIINISATTIKTTEFDVRHITCCSI